LLQLVELRLLLRCENLADAVPAVGHGVAQSRQHLPPQGVALRVALLEDLIDPLHLVGRQGQLALQELEEVIASKAAGPRTMRPVHGEQMSSEPADQHPDKEQGRDRSERGEAVHDPNPVESSTQPSGSSVGLARNEAAGSGVACQDNQARISSNAQVAGRTRTAAQPSADTGCPCSRADTRPAKFASGSTWA